MAKFRDLAVDNRFDASGVISLAADWMEQGNYNTFTQHLQVSFDS